MCSNSVFPQTNQDEKRAQPAQKPALIFKCWDSWKNDFSTYSDATAPKQLGCVLWNTLAATDKYALFAVKIYGERIIKATRSLSRSRINHLRAIFIRSALHINTLLRPRRAELHTELVQDVNNGPIPEDLGHCLHVRVCVNAWEWRGSSDKSRVSTSIQEAPVSQWAANAPDIKQSHLAEAPHKTRRCSQRQKTSKCISSCVWQSRLDGFYWEYGSRCMQHELEIRDHKARRPVDCHPVLGLELCFCSA